MESRFHVPSRPTVARDCYESFLTEKRKLKSVLRKCNSRVSITTASWTSIQQINYMVLTVILLTMNANCKKGYRTFVLLQVTRVRKLEK